MPRFNLYSSNEQKESADTSLMLLLDDMGYTQQYTAEFTRLTVSFCSVAIAAGVWWLEKKNGFRESYTIIAAACAVYFVLQSVAYAIWHFVEKGANYIGTSKNGTIYIKTESPKKAPGTYVITVASAGKAPRSQTLQFGAFVDYNGNVIKSELSRVLKKLVQ